VNKLFELDEIKLIEDVFLIVLSVFPDELAKNWLKMHQFLSFLLMVTVSGKK